eukprot:5256904-Lingulodinium_polyedra.AAC.1
MVLLYAHLVDEISIQIHKFLFCGTKVQLMEDDGIGVKSVLIIPPYNALSAALKSAHNDRTKYVLQQKKGKRKRNKSAPERESSENVQLGVGLQLN